MKMVQLGLNCTRRFEMVPDGLKWYKKVQYGPRFQNGQRCLKRWKKVHVAYGKKKRKLLTILLISMDQYFFCVFFFSLCSNPSTWPGRQVDPDGSQCYFLIFDGLVVLNKSAKARAQNCPDITILNSPFVSLSFRSFVLILW